MGVACRHLQNRDQFELDIPDLEVNLQNMQDKQFFKSMVLVTEKTSINQEQLKCVSQT